MNYPLLFNHIIYENFTNSIDESILVLQTGEKTSAAKLKDRNIDSFIKFIEEHLTEVLPNTPHIIYTGCGSVKYFETKIYDSETIKLLNKNGLEIFLYEELSISTGDIIPYYLNVTTPNDSVFFNKYGNFIRGFELTDNNIKTMYCFELESIKKFIENNGLTNVTVNCCEYNVEKYLQKIYPMMKIRNKNIYIKFLAKKLQKNKKSIVLNNKSISKKFLSFNNKYKGYRHLISAYLYDKNSNISFDHNKAVYGNLKNHLWFNINKWKIDYPEHFAILSKNLIDLKNNNPLVLDTSESIPNPNFNLDFNYTPNNFFEESFCSVITETFYSKPITALTEKTINAIANFHPFILVAPPHTLEHLKSLGFKTFEKYWDESYDQEENHEKRLIKIFQLINEISKKSIDELTDLHHELSPILEHNYNNIDHL